MAASDVLTTVDGPVATVTLNRPDAGNALTGAMMEAIRVAFSSLGTNPAVRAVVLTGAGKYFSTGMDVRKGATPPPGAAQHKPYAAFDAILRCPKPVVALVNGPAMGGGFGLLCCCDIRVMSSNAFAALSEVAVGVYPAMISAFVIPQIGPSRAQYMMLTGNRVPAADLERWGLVAEIAEPGAKLEGAFKKTLQSLLRNAVSAQAGCKRLIQQVAYGGEDHDDLMGVLSAEFRTMMASPERRYAAKAFAETRRPPDWNEYYATKRGPASKL